jgi:hypothetical protein
MLGDRFCFAVTSIVFCCGFLLLASRAQAQGTNCVSAPSGVVGWWSAERDASDRAFLNPATVQGGVSFEAGAVGNAFGMHGGVDAVKVAASDSLDVGAGGGMTIEAWINPQTLSVASPLVEWNHEGTNFTEWGVHFWILKPGDFGLGAGSLFANLAEANGTAHFIYTAAGTIVPDQWQHVAMTYDKSSGRARLYRNGAIMADLNLGSFRPETSYNLFLGRRPAGDSTRSYFGLLDEPSIYNRALAQAEIQDIYNAGTSGKCPVGDPGVGENHSPSISKIAGQSVLQGKSTGPIPFTVADVETAPEDLSITFSSLDPELISDADIRLGGFGGNRTVTLTAGTNQSGTATINLEVSDGEATRWTTLTVLVVLNTNQTQAPTISHISDRTVSMDEPTAAIDLGVADADTPWNLLRLHGASSNPALVPNENIFFGTANAKWYLTVTPVFGQTGTSTISVTVSDGTDQSTTQFNLAVNPIRTGSARFLNPDAISIPVIGTASPYPSGINVTGMGGTISKLVFSIDKFSHANVHDVNMLLVSPLGQAVVIFSHVSGNRLASNVRVNLTDSSGFFLPSDFNLWSEPLKPAAFGNAVSFPAPAPSGGYGVIALSTFNNLSPNGIWSLYVYDDTDNNGGGISGGWSLSISTSGGLIPTISDIPDQSVLPGRATPPVPFVINDAETPVDQLVLTANSSNPALVSPDNIVFGGSGSNRTISVISAPNQSGSAIITATVSDGTNSASDSFILTVGPAPILAVTVDSAVREYGTSNPIFAGRMTGLRNGDAITVSFRCTATPASPIGTYEITPRFEDPDNKLDKYDVRIQNGTLTISPVVLVGTPQDTSRRYGAANPNFTVNYTGFVNGEDATILTGSLLTFTPANTNSPPGTYPITLSGQGAPNYSIYYKQGTVTVTGAVLVIRADNSTRSYGALNPPLTGTISGIQNGDNISANYIVSATTSSAADIYSIAPVPVDPDGKLRNYAVVVQDGTCTVTQASLTITADDKTRLAGTDNPPLTGIITGLQNGDAIVARYATTATRLSPPDNYRITPSLLDPENRLNNYRVTKRYGTLTVTLMPASLLESLPPLDVNANDATRVYGTANPTFTGTVTGMQEGDGITATYSSAAVPSSPADIYAIALHLDDPGGNLRKYTLITHEGALTVTPVSLNISIDDHSRPYGAPNPALTGSTVGLLPGDNIVATFITSANQSSPVGAYSVEAEINDTQAKLSNYSLTVRNGTLTVRGSSRVKITSISRSQGQAHIIATGDASVTYTIQASPDLISWTNIGNATSDATGLFEFDSGVPDPGFRFFRMFLP